MDKKHYIIEAVLAVAVIVLFILTFTGTSKSRSAVVTDPKTGKTEMPIAYVRMDSLLSQYQYYKDLNENLSKEAEQHRTQLAGKANALQKAAQDFERRMRINAFTSAEAQQMEQQKLMKMQQEGQALEAKLTQNFAVKQQLLNEEMQNEIKKNIEEMNKDGRYRLILTNVGMDNILYGDKALDITEEVVKYLNDHYKKGDLTQQPAETAKK